MKTISYESLTRFEWWAGAKDNAGKLTYTELQQLDDILDELYPDGLEEVQINDFMWFDFDSVCNWLSLDVDEVEGRE